MTTLIKCLKISLAGLLLTYIGLAEAQDPPPAPLSEKDQGIDFEAILTTDWMANTRGGIKRTSRVLGNIDLTATFDTERLGLWEDGTFFLYGLGNAGGDPSTYVGDIQVSDNIETNDTAKLYEAWYEHRFIEDRISVLAGLHDLNSEFYVLDNASTLINSSFGVGPDLSQIGPSIFSTTALALRARVSFSDSVSLAAAVYDGVPGDPENDRGTRIRFDSHDGTFSIGELSYTSAEGDPHTKLGFGLWYSTARFEDISEIDREWNMGYYGLAEIPLLLEQDNAQGLGAFLSLGSADKHRNQIDRFTGIGLIYTGAIPSRDEDVVSFGVAQAHNSNRFLEFNEGTERAETAYELTYRIVISDHISVQPDIQYIVNPGTDPALDNAVIVGVRTELGL